MKVLTIKQPWAFLIIHGGKDIENRTWRTKYRGRFLVHSAKVDDRAAMRRFRDWINPDDLVRGAVIGSVELTDVVDSHESQWFQGPIGFVLKNPRPEPMVYVRGKLNFWELNQEEV